MESGSRAFWRQRRAVEATASCAGGGRRLSGANSLSGAVARDPSGQMGAEEAPHDPDASATGATDEVRGSLRRLAVRELPRNRGVSPSPWGKKYLDPRSLPSISMPCEQRPGLWARSRPTAPAGPFHADRPAARPRCPPLFLGTLVSRPHRSAGASPSHLRARHKRSQDAVPRTFAAPIRPNPVPPREPVSQRETTSTEPGSPAPGSRLPAARLPRAILTAAYPHRRRATTIRPCTGKRIDPVGPGPPGTDWFRRGRGALCHRLRRSRRAARPGLPGRPDGLPGAGNSERTPP